MDTSFNQAARRNPESTPGSPETISRQSTFQSRGSRNKLSTPSNSREPTDEILTAKQRPSYPSGNHGFKSQARITSILSASSHRTHKGAPWEEELSQTDEEWQIPVGHSAIKGGAQRKVGKLNPVNIISKEDSVHFARTNSIDTKKYINARLTGARATSKSYVSTDGKGANSMDDKPK